MTVQIALPVTDVASVVATYRDEIDPITYARIIRDLVAKCHRLDAQFNVAAFEEACRLERPWLNYFMFDDGGTA